jgi:toxic protein SymE
MSFKSRKTSVQSFFSKSTWKRSVKPKITISGDWLKDAGINIGDSLTIEVENNKLTLIKN